MGAWVRSGVMAIAASMAVAALAQPANQLIGPSGEGILGGGGSVEHRDDGPGPGAELRPFDLAIGPPQPYQFFPQGGTLWQDLVINNHVDLGSSGMPLDFDCTDRTYSGHRGHDADIVGFREQQIGMPVFAALDGVVTATHDGELDTNVQALGQPANFVILSHGNGQNTWYWHLKRDSVAVTVGQTVVAGMQIGLTGSSGSSTWPHLHFESQVDGVAYEPSAGPCRPGPSYWVHQRAVRQSTFAKSFTFANQPFSGNAGYPWDQVLHTGTYPLGTLTTYFRMSMANYPLNGAYRITYTRPNGTAALDFSGVFYGSFRNGWLWFQMSPSGGLDVVGTWTARFYVNDVLIVTAPFEVVATSTIMNHAPLGVSVALDPPDPLAADAPFCRVAPTVLYRRDPDYDVVRYRYRWLVDGILVRDVQTAALSDAIRRGLVSSGNRLTCEVTPIDDYGVAGPSSSASNAVTPADLVVDFGSAYGTWVVAGATWSQLHGLSPLAMVAGDLDGNGSDDLVLNFGPGIGVWAWMNHATWTVLHPFSPSQMVTGDLDDNGRDEVVFVFPGYGIWRWSDGSWTRLHGLDATHLAVGQLDGLAGDDLVVDFPGSGLYLFANNNTWTGLHGFHAEALLTGNLDGSGRDDIVVDFGPPYGLWVYRNNSAWTQLHGLSPAHLAAGDIDGNGRADLVIDFGAPHGLWTFRNDTAWVPLHGLSAEGLVLADRDGTGKDEVVIDFGAANGLWQYANDTGWNQLHPFSPEDVVAGRFH